LSSDHGAAIDHVNGGRVTGRKSPHGSCQSSKLIERFILPNGDRHDLKPRESRPAKSKFYQRRHNNPLSALKQKQT
jgi:hypothetical protein